MGQVLTKPSGELLPQSQSALTTAVPDMESDDLVSCDIHGNPDPLPIRFLPDEALELVELGL